MLECFLAAGVHDDKLITVTSAYGSNLCMDKTHRIVFQRNVIRPRRAGIFLICGYDFTKSENSCSPLNEINTVALHFQGV